MPGRRLLPLLLLTCVLPLQAQVYTWVDENGQKHFGNQPPATQPVQEVNVRHGYVSDGPPPAPAVTAGETTPTSGAESAASEPADTVMDERKMCSEAIRWTGIDLPNLKEIAGERKAEGRLTREQYDKVIKGLDEGKRELTVSNCLASKGQDRERYECLSKGLGVMVCSGAMDNVFGK